MWVEHRRARMMTDGGGGWNGILSVLEEVISCVLISSPTLCCTVYWPANWTLHWLSLARKVCMCVCCSMNSQVKKEGTTQNSTHTFTGSQADTHTPDGGLFSMGRGLSWSGQLPLSSHLFESLLALSGSSTKHTIKKTRSCTHVASDFVTYLVLLLGLFHGLEKVILSTNGTCAKPSYLVLTSLTVADTSCLSNDHTLACDWLVWRERGGEKNLNLFKQNFSALVFFLHFVKFLFFDSFVLERASLCCWAFIIWNNTWLPNTNLATP